MSVPPQKPAVSRGKLAVVALLAIALVAVWGPQLLSSGEPPLALQPTAPIAPTQSHRPVGIPRPHAAGPIAAANGSVGSPPVAKPVRVRDRAPAITVAQAAEHDPFRLPPWSPEAIERATAAEAVATAEAVDPVTGAPVAEQVDPQQRLEELQKSGVGMILVSKGRRSATIGDRTVREGDEINGFRVVEITATEVLLSPSVNGAPVEGPRDAP